MNANTTTRTQFDISKELDAALETVRRLTLVKPLNGHAVIVQVARVCELRAEQALALAPYEGAMLRHDLEESLATRRTPGPWHAEITDRIRIEAHGNIIAEVIGSPDDPAARDNAVLIAESPALLEACLDALSLFKPGHAIDRFDWKRSFLRAQDVRELNELPTRIRNAISRALRR